MSHPEHAERTFDPQTIELLLDHGALVGDGILEVLNTYRPESDPDEVLTFTTSRMNPEDEGKMRGRVILMGKDETLFVVAAERSGQLGAYFLSSGSRPGSEILVNYFQLDPETPVPTVIYAGEDRSDVALGMNIGPTAWVKVMRWPAPHFTHEKQWSDAVQRLSPAQLQEMQLPGRCMSGIAAYQQQQVA